MNCRCVKHGPPAARTREYVAFAEPIGYPCDTAAICGRLHSKLNLSEERKPCDTAAICGRLHCDKPGLLWLEPDEVQAYHDGQRIFEFQFGQGGFVKIKVKDNSLVMLAGRA